MKLQNGWRQLDRELFKKIETQKEELKIAIYGAGKIGGELYRLLKKCGIDSVFIDNDKDKQRNGHMGETVVSYEVYSVHTEEFTWVAISATERNAVEMEQQLSLLGMQPHIDYGRKREFVNDILPLIMFVKFEKSFVGLAQISVTERCSLKCKKCAHACYHVEATHKDLTIEQVKKSADSFFSRVDVIDEFVLIGGEPLLYKNLPGAVAYIGEKYRDHMNIFSITTNGTIMPSEELMKECKKYQVLFRISNYSGTLPRLKPKYENLVQLLHDHEIDYSLCAEEKLWMDYGFEYVNRCASDAELEKVFDACRTPCHEVRENRLYYCVMARSVSENLGYDVGQKDYLDLESMDKKEWRKDLLDFVLGYSEKGYLDMCNFCHGAEVENYPIPAAEQL